MKQYNAIDLFCGAGGLSYGFESAGFNILLGIDSDQKALEVFERYSSSLLTPERLKGVEKVAELLAEALLNAQYTEPNKKELPQCEEDTNE